MSLKLIRRGRTFYLRGTVGPAERRERVFETTGTDDPATAEAYRVQREKELWDRIIHGERETVTFTRAANSYIEHAKPAEGDKRRVRRLAAWFGQDAKLKDITQAALDRCCAGMLERDAANGTKLRSVYIPVTAILTHAAKRGWCDRPIFDRPAQPKGRTVFLTPAQAVALHAEAAPHLKPIILFGLCTGGRVSEILGLTWADVDLTARTCVFRDTKNGRDRIVKLAPRAVTELGALPHREGAVFRKPGVALWQVKGKYRRKGSKPVSRTLGEPYAEKDEGGGQFKKAFRGACDRAGLPREVIPHVMRHTWATWFQAATRDPLRLMYEGGWSGLSLVERYAHLMATDLVPGIARIWGADHPDRFGGAQTEQPATANQDQQAGSAG